MRAVLVLLAAAALALVAAPAAGQVEGEEEYLEHCSRCHGATGLGSAWGPSLVDSGAAGTHYSMATGRMPITWPDEVIRPGPPLLPEEEIEAITAYVYELVGGPVVEDLDLEGADLSVGAELYLLECAACHGGTGVGGALVNSENAPDVLGVAPLQIAEAIRTGPGAMPVYGPDTFEEEELEAIVAYVVYLQEGPVNRGGPSIGRLGPVTEGAIAWLVGLGVAVLAAVWIESTVMKEDA